MKRLRLALILLAVLLLGLVSFVFGMFMAVASDLPSLDSRQEFNNARNSVLLDDQGRPLGVLSNHNQILVTPSQIPQIVKEATIAIEDKRFQSNSGIDVRGIARAFLQDVLHKRAVQGASTIEQQFVKNALQAQSHRTIFEKLRETALAYQLAHRWSKEKIITEYLNTIYFGNGAYGIESAARTYFGQDVNHLGCGTPGHPLCVQELGPWEAALLAGIIQSPTYYDPVTYPAAARARRNLVLGQMLQQGYLTRSDYEESVNQSLPAPRDIQIPHQTLVEGIDAGYFTSWVQQQVIERYNAARAFDGGLRIQTTLDLDLQRAAEQAIGAYLPGPGGPTASLVAIENSTGQVRAMVGGRDYNRSSFNLATEGERQPGSAFKAFVLATALERGISPGSVWPSRVKVFSVPGGGKFVVHNDEGAYTGSNSLTGATTYSDNSIFAEVGINVGTRRIANLAHRMGIGTPISINPAMTIGGLKVGVTPLDMAHGYETIAHGGQRVTGTLASGGAPVGIQEVDDGSGTLPDGHHRDVNRVMTERVLPADVAATETSMLEGVIQSGTGRAAAIGQFAAGKTGTTSNYGDAWFVGWDSKYTVAVWVGYPDRLVPMTTDFNGQPVFGGTFPALIWHNFLLSAIQIDQNRPSRVSTQRVATEAGSGATSTSSATPSSSPPGQTPGGAKARSTPGSQGGGGSSTPAGGGNRTGAGGGEHGSPAPATPAPSEAPTPAAPPGEAPPAPKGGGTAPTGGVSPGR